MHSFDYFLLEFQNIFFFKQKNNSILAVSLSSALTHQWRFQIDAILSLPSRLTNVLAGQTPHFLFPDAHADAVAHHAVQLINVALKQTAMQQSVVQFVGEPNKSMERIV